jgi:hypothetical protein
MATFADQLLKLACPQENAIAIHLLYCHRLRKQGDHHQCQCSEVFDREIGFRTRVFDVIRIQMRLQYSQYIHCMITGEHDEKMRLLNTMRVFANEELGTDLPSVFDSDVFDLENALRTEMNQYPGARAAFGL